MFLKQIDILSPEITLYFKGNLSHSSKISGILTIIVFILIILCSLYFFGELFNRKNSSPKVSSFSIFTEDAGIIPINSSSFFHFISIVKDSHYPEYENFDFTSFTLIGLDTYMQDYELDNNLTKYNHWLYGFCNNDTDTNGISYLITQDYFTKSACIKKYFDSSKQEYYDIGNPNFKWPKLAHGTFNKLNQFYGIVLLKCDNILLKKVFGEEYNCKNDKEIDEIFKFGLIHFNFIDYYVDVLKYKEIENIFIE